MKHGLAGLTGLLLLASGCAGPARELALPVPDPPQDEIDFSLYLIGDAGKPAPEGEPVLLALSSEIDARSSPGAVVFLGDNIYPQGMPRPDDPDRAEMERRIDAQLDAVLATPARGFFIPGNHDWSKGGDDGWDAVRRQDEHVDIHGGDRAVHLPDDGCPGPDVVDLGARLRLVILDTQWWFHGGAKPGADSDCKAATRESLMDSLRSALASAGDRRVVVAGHHPLVSSGPHGGHFTLKDHLFPLTAVKSWLWLPLPVIGSAYPIARQAGISGQDQSSSVYEELKEALGAVFSEYPPLVYASGHEHALEVFEGDTARYLLVSGGGFLDHASSVEWRDRTLFAASAAGFMRLDVLANGRVRLGVFVVTGPSEVREAFSLMLE